jgi:hypothetical protein
MPGVGDRFGSEREREFTEQQLVDHTKRVRRMLARYASAAGLPQPISPQPASPFLADLALAGC